MGFETGPEDRKQPVETSQNSVTSSQYGSPRRPTHYFTGTFGSAIRFASNWYAPAVPAGSWRHSPSPR